MLPIAVGESAYKSVGLRSCAGRPYLRTVVDNMRDWPTWWYDCSERTMGIPLALVLFPFLASVLLGCLILLQGQAFVPLVLIPMTVASFGVVHPLTGLFLTTHVPQASRATLCSANETGHSVGRFAGCVTASVLLPYGIWLPTTAACALSLMGMHVACPLRWVVLG